MLIDMCHHRELPGQQLYREPQNNDDGDDDNVQIDRGPPDLMPGLYSDCSSHTREPVLLIMKQQDQSA